MNLQCPKCQSGETQNLSVIYESGFSTSTSSVNVYVPGQPSYVGGTQTTTAQTDLSRRAAPPRAKSWGTAAFIAFFAGLYGLYSIPALQMWIVLHLAERVMDVGEVPPNLNYSAAGWMPGTYGMIALGLCALCMFLVMRAVTYNRTAYPPLIERWRRSFLCRRCGEMFATS